MVNSQKNRRDSQRFRVHEKRSATLIDREARIPLNVIEISSGGFGAFTDETPTIEIGNNYVFETETGSHNVTIAHIHETDEGNFIGLRRLSDIIDESVFHQTKPANSAKKFHNYYGNDRTAIIGLMVLTLVVAGIFLWSIDSQSPTLADSTDQQKSQQKNPSPNDAK